MVPGACVLSGLRLPVTPAQVPVPVLFGSGSFSLKVAVLIVKGSIASLKAAAMLPLMATPVAALAGTVALTVGRVVSGVSPVVKLQTKLLTNALPARSLTPVVLAV